MPNKETHRAFNQLLNTFLEINNKEEELAQDGTSSIKLVPIFLYNDCLLYTSPSPRDS